MYDPTVLQPPRASAGTSIVLLFICALAGVAGIAVSWGMVDLVKQMQSGTEVTLEQGLGVLALFFVQSLAAAAVFLLTGIFFLMWMYKSVAFARFVAPAANTMSPAWAWTLIVPALGQILPVQLAHSAYISCQRADQQRRGNAARLSGGGIVLTWGALWAIMWVSSVLLRLGTIGQSNPFVEGATAEAVLTFWYAYMGLQAITTLTAITGAVMIMKFSALQGRLVGAGLDSTAEDLPPALLRAGLPAMGAAAAEPDSAPPLMRTPPQRPAAAPTVAATRTPAPAPASAPARHAGLPGMPPPAPAEEQPRQFMPGIPPPPGQQAA